MTTEPIDDTTEVETPGGNVERISAGTNPDDGAEDSAQSAEETDDTHPNAEAARYRTKLRESEAANAVLAEHVTALQRQIVEGQCAAAGVKPLALWSVTELADLINEDGSVDSTKVHEAVMAAADSLGIPTGLRVPREGYQPSEPGPPNGRQQWDNAFRPPVAR